MRTRTLIGIAVATLVLSLTVVGGFSLIDRQTRLITDQDVGTPSIEAASAAQSAAGRPVVPEPDDPVVAEVAVATEPMTSPALEPRRAPALDPVPPGSVTIAVVVLPAPARLAEPEAPVPVGDADLTEGLVAPALSPIELRMPSLSLVPGDCRDVGPGDAL